MSCILSCLYMCIILQVGPLHTPAWAFLMFQLLPPKDDIINGDSIKLWQKPVPGALFTTTLFHSGASCTCTGPPPMYIYVKPCAVSHAVHPNPRLCRNSILSCIMLLLHDWLIRWLDNCMDVQMFRIKWIVSAYILNVSKLWEKEVVAVEWL